MSKRKIIVIAHDIRSAHNVGSLLRTCEGLGVEYVYLTGYTPYPHMPKNDTRLPHIALKLTKSINKTALGADETQKWEHRESIDLLLESLQSSGFEIIALEQSPKSIPINHYKMPDKVVILIGREVEGIDSDLLNKIETHIEIPMYGKKESFNVIQATAMVLYVARFC